jgi:hypothetical protein
MVQEKSKACLGKYTAVFPPEVNNALMVCAAENIDKGYENKLKHLTTLNWRHIPNDCTFHSQRMRCSKLT